MKAKLKHCLDGFQGKLDGMVFYRVNHCGKLLARRHVIPGYSESNRRIGQSTRAIMALNPSENYRKDLATYLNWYQCLKDERLKKYHSWANVYVALMFNLAKAHPGIDLMNITREAVYAQNLPCISVKRAVEAGLLPPVHNWEKMEGEM